MPDLVLIAAVARNGIIGSDNDMPWRLPTDLKRFKRLTLGSPLVLGRKTFLSFGGRPLPGRPHVVISRDSAYGAEGIETAASLEAALQRARQLAEASDAADIFCVGGGQVYAQAISQADRLEITEVDAAPDGDTRFPEIDPLVWEETAREQGVRTGKDSADFTYVTYRRKA